MSTSAAGHRPVLGLAAFLFGVLALVAATLHVSGTFAAPERSAAATVGEIAAEIRESARRAIGREAPPEPAPQAGPGGAERALVLAIPALAGLAAVLGAVGLFRREARTLPTMAIGMGVGAFVMQYLFWLAVVIGGICLLIAIVNNIEDILGG